MPDIGRLLKLRIWHEKRHPFAGWHLAKVRPIALSVCFCQCKLCTMSLLSTDLDTELEFILHLKREERYVRIRL